MIYSYQLVYTHKSILLFTVFNLLALVLSILAHARIDSFFNGKLYYLILLSILAHARIDSANLHKNVQFFRAHIRTAHKDYFMWDLLFVIFNKEPYRERYTRYEI